MSSTDQNTPTTKSGRRGRKGSSRNPKPELPQADQLQATEPPIDIAAAPADAEIMEAAAGGWPSRTNQAGARARGRIYLKRRSTTPVVRHANFHFTADP